MELLCKTEVKEFLEQIRAISQETIALRSLLLWEGFCFFFFSVSLLHNSHTKKSINWKSFKKSCNVGKSLKFIHTDQVLTKVLQHQTQQKKIDVKIDVKFITHARVVMSLFIIDMIQNSTNFSLKIVFKIRLMKLHAFWD